MNELKIDKNNNEYSVFNKIKAPRRESRTYTEVFWMSEMSGWKERLWCEHGVGSIPSGQCFRGACVKIITIITTSSYIALSTPKGISECFRHYNLLSLGLNSFLKSSQLPGEYTACATLICATKLKQSQEPSLPSQVPIYPWMERSNYNCHAQGHKCHNLDSNPHSAEQKHRAWVRYSYPLGQGTLQFTLILHDARTMQCLKSHRLLQYILS